MPEIDKVAMFPSQRFLVAFLAFLGNVFIYVARVNLSVAIVCMVRDGSTVSDNSSLASLGGISNTTTISPSLGGACGDVAGTGSNQADRGEFDWDKPTVGRMLSMYFYGYIFLQFPGGYLSSRFGGKRVWGVCQLVSAVCTLLTPVCARTSIYLAYTVRFLVGFASGVTFPSVHALLGKWSPPLEISRMASITFSANCSILNCVLIARMAPVTFSSKAFCFIDYKVLAVVVIFGPLIGNIVTFSISGLMCEYGFDNGWGSIFYIAGIGNLIWVVAWFLLVADSPDKHRYISDKERLYITSSIGKGGIKKFHKTPWLAIFTSVPMLGAVLAHSCSNYMNYTLMTNLPTYMKESLNFDIKANGVLSALPYICQFFMAMLVGQVADRIRERRLMSTRNVRKLFQSTAFIGVGLFVCIMGQMGCEQRYAAVAMLCLGFILLSANTAGYISNHLDLAPSYAGICFGISNTMATIPGILAPTVSSALTPGGSTEEWRNVFYLCTGVGLFGMILYAFMADGELQPWAISPEVNLRVEVEVDKVKKGHHPASLVLLEPEKEHV